MITSKTLTYILLRRYRDMKVYYIFYRDHIYFVCIIEVDNFCTPDEMLGIDKNKI